MARTADRTLNDRRTRYLTVAKEITQELLKRDGLYSDLCPAHNRLCEDARHTTLRDIAACTARIESLCDEVRTIESEPGTGLGIPVLFQPEPGNVIRTTVTLLLTCACSAAARRFVHEIGELLDIVGGRDPASALELRIALRADGVLRPFVRFDMDIVLSECANVALTEDAFNRLLALPPDPEFKALDSMRAKMGRIRA